MAAIARIDEGDIGGALDRLPDDRRVVLLTLGMGAQGRGEVETGPERRGQTEGEALPAMGGGRGDAGDLLGGGGVETRGIIRGEIVQRRPALGGNQQDFRRMACCGRNRRSRRRAGRVGQDHMGVGTAEPERVDAGEALGAARQRQRRPIDREVQGLERDVGIQLGRVERGREQVVLQGEARLEQAGETRDRLGMADIGLDRTDRQRRLPLLAEHAADGARLDRIADRRTGAVRLDEGDAIRIDGGIAIDLLQQGALGAAGRQGDPGGASVRVDAARRDDPVHDPSAAGGGFGRLEDQDDAALGPHIAIGIGREGLAQAGAREHLRIGEGNEVERADEQARARHHRGIDLTGLDRRDRGVERHERGRTGGIEREARAFQVEDVGDAVRDDRERVAGRRVSVAGGRIEDAQVAVIEGGGADEHADIRARDRGRAQARILKGFPGQLQQQALLRIHLLGLAGRDAEYAGVERPDVVENARRPGVALAALLRPRMRVGRERPAIFGNPGDGTAALGQKLPQTLDARRSGEAASAADDRDVFAVSHVDPLRS